MFVSEGLYNISTIYHILALDCLKENLYTKKGEKKYATEKVPLFHDGLMQLLHVPSTEAIILELE